MVPVEGQSHGDGVSRGAPKWQYWGSSWGIHSDSTADTTEEELRGYKNVCIFVCIIHTL